MKRRHIIIGSLVAVFAITGFIFATEYTFIAEAREQFAEVDTTDAYTHGELLFQTRGCAGCHAFEAANSDGDTGPDLTAIGYRNTEYIRQSIVDPNAVIAGGCPEEACEGDIMPNYGRILDDQQTDALVVYLSAQS